MLDFRTFGQLLVLSMAPDYPELERAKSQLFRWVLIVTRDIKELDIYVYISCTAYTRIPNILRLHVVRQTVSDADRT